MGKRSEQPLWTCHQCRRQFANPNQSHACARYTLAEHLEGKAPEVIALYLHLEAVIQGLGPVIVNPEKTRIAFQMRMSFAAVTLKRQWIDGHVVLARRLESPRFRRVETISPRNHVHSFRLTCPQDIDEEFVAWLVEAYQVGEQRHLERYDRLSKKNSHSGCQEESAVSHSEPMDARRNGSSSEKR